MLNTVYSLQFSFPSVVFNGFLLKVSLPPVLKYYDQNQRQITRQVDASNDGLGGCIMQNGQPIAYGSRSLTKTE